VVEVLSNRRGVSASESSAVPYNRRVDLIVSHIGADFDALASMLAARRLHPGARLFFPGSREESVRRWLEERALPLDELRRRDVDPTALRRVVLCDIRQRDRIGVVGEWLSQNPAIEVVAYDHHPDSREDVPHGSGLVDATVGATATLFCEEFERQQIQLSVDEATVLLLGLYEDTGSLTYATTSPRDLAAVGWLLAQGGELAVVRKFAARGLDATRIDVLHRMLHALTVERVRGHRIGFVEIDLGEHVEELAPLVSRCLELFELPALFALFAEGERLTVIARGSLAGLDLGALLADAVGGGGHATAAAGSLREMTLVECHERLLAGLAKALPAAALVRDLMISPVLVLAAGTSVAEAKAQLNVWRVNAAPVAESNGATAIGSLVTRQLLDSALQHGLGDRPVETVASREVHWIAADAEVDELAERVARSLPRLVLVGDAQERRPLGVVTRMTLLRHLQSQLAATVSTVERRARGERGVHARIGTLLREGAPAGMSSLLQTVASVSAELSVPVYAVGGFVRDLFLGEENRDLDLVVEGDGLEFARSLAKALGGHAREHPEFLTAVVVDATGRHVDVATARSEFYRAPAALPQVQMSMLRQDLYRRDFTINTLAIRLGPAGEPELMDFFGGRRDLEAKALRVLHSLSLLDDPTRAFRAVRLEQRLGLRIADETERLIRIALQEGAFDKLSAARLRDEVHQLLAHPRSAMRALARLDELRLLTVLDPELRWSPDSAVRLEGVVAALDWYRLEGLSAEAVVASRLLLAALALELPQESQRVRLATRLALGHQCTDRLRNLPERLRGAASCLLEKDARPHRISLALRDLHAEELLLLLAGSDEGARTWVRRELTEMRQFTLVIGGGDLLAAGFAAGPAIGEALRVTRAARLDGELVATQELDHAVHWLRQHGSLPAPTAERPAK
jgi:tRNA nucleotidyltransferase (CCA-adding enzyme)